ncbi:hypothetical protein CPC08DRAFT_768417 [Agrocybe pediades]|nr:hypothetical protein CPC08DRAFT_768417 [Agrocybe pediades]
MPPVCRSCGTPDSLDTSSADFTSVITFPAVDHVQCAQCKVVEESRNDVYADRERLNASLRRLGDAQAQLNLIHSPFLKKFPNEIISMIFQQAYDHLLMTTDIHHKAENGLVKSKRLYLALRLAGVCKKWQSIAYSMPALWSDIHVCLHRQIKDESCAILKRVLERSRSYPLSLSLYYTSIDGMGYARAGGTQYKSCLAMLGQQSFRWHSLTTHLPCMIIETLLSFTTGDLSKFVSWDGKGLNPESLSVTSNTFAGLDICLQKVKRIIAHDFCTDQAVKLLRAAPMLTSYTLEELDETESINLPRNFVHDNLQHLSYNVSDFNSMNPSDNIFSFNIFPHLTRLEYSSGKYEEPFLDQLEKHHPPLKKLCIKYSLIDADFFIRALRAVPTLTHLELYPYAFDEDLEDDHFIPIFMALANENTFPPLSSEERETRFLPCLESLKVCFPHPFPWSIVPDFFGPYSDPYGRPLKNFEFYEDVKIQGPSSIPRNNLIELLALRRSGINIQYKSYLRPERDLFQASLEFHDILIPTKF